MTDDNPARDFLAIWQSELVAMAADRELREGWTALVTLWGNSAAAFIHDHPPSGSAGAAQPAGPRPLALHLTLAWMKSHGFTGTSPNWNNVWADLNTASQTDLPGADAALIAGIAAYRQFDYQRQMPDPPVAWEEGETQLFDYGGQGHAVVFIPSLVNRAYILDLMPDGSMLRWLAGQNLRPYLLDWGWPGPVERQFTLTDYIAGRRNAPSPPYPGPVILAGYCMGGLLALAAALRLPNKVKALALLATPWDFHAAIPPAQNAWATWWGPWNR